MIVEWLQVIVVCSTVQPGPGVVCMPLPPAYCHMAEDPHCVPFVDETECRLSLLLKRLWWTTRNDGSWIKGDPICTRAPKGLRSS